MSKNQSKDKLSTIAVLCKVADVKEKLYDEATEKYEIDCENPDFELAYDEAYTTYYDRTCHKACASGGSGLNIAQL